MVDWTAARQMTERKVSAVFDVQTCTLKPRRDGVSVNHGRQDDSSRVSFDFIGTIDLQPSGELLARHRSQDPAAHAANPHFDAVLTANAEGWPHMPRKGDHVASSVDVWEIAAVATDGGIRKAYYLVRA